MKLLRHILSHLILLTFLFGIVSVFYYRTLLLPTDMVARIDRVTKDIYPPAVEFSSKREYFWASKEKAQAESVQNVAKENSVPQEAAPVARDTMIVTATDESRAQNPVTEKQNDIPEAKETVSKVQAEPADGPETGAVVAKAIPGKSAESQVPEKIIPDMSEMKPVVKDIDASSERDVLIYARSAFLQGNMQQSEKHYLSLIELDQDNADAYGELGNVYYAQGKWQQAGQLYYEAAVRLMSAGDHQQVTYLHRVIKGLDSEHADKLAQMMARK